MEFSEFLEKHLPQVRMGAEWRALIMFGGEEASAQRYLDHLAQERGVADWRSSDMAVVNDIAVFLLETVYLDASGEEDG